jgi:hypothetical protein
MEDTNEHQHDEAHPHEHQPRQVPPLMAATWEAAVSDPDPLVALGATRALVGLLSTWESRLAGEAVAAGATWETVGSTVGVSRQAAWERFHDEAHELRQRARDEMRQMASRHREEMFELRQRIKDEARARRRPAH